MNRENIIRMAREASVPYDSWPSEYNKNLEHLVQAAYGAGAAAERNRIWTQEHWTDYERSIAAAEREACAKLCENQPMRQDIDVRDQCAAAIRARGQA